jgi:hypothetical protein
MSTYHVTVIGRAERRLHSCGCLGCNGAAETDMKIYLLVLLVGALLTAIRLTSDPKRKPEPLRQ